MRQNEIQGPVLIPSGPEMALTKSLIDHQAACDLELLQHPGHQALRRVAEVAPRRQLEVAEYALCIAERRQQAGHADRRMRASVEWQQQQFQMGGPAIFCGRGEAG